MSNKVARIWRRANVSEDVALAGINLRYPPDQGWTISSFAKETREDDSGTFDAFVAELEKTAAPFPPDDEAADKGDGDLPTPEPDEEDEAPEPHEKKEKSGDSEVLSLLHKIIKHLGLDGSDEHPPVDDAPDLSKPGDSLPPPAKPLPTMNPNAAPHNMPAFGSVAIEKIAKQQTSFIEIDDDGRKNSAYVTEANQVLAPFGKKITCIQRGTVEGRKLIRAQVE